MTVSKIIQAVLVHGTMLCLLGCEVPTRELSKWDISVISPSGERQVYTVMSHNKPRPDPQWGGQTRVVDTGHSSYHDWERQIVAPAGWMLTVEPSR